MNTEWKNLGVSTHYQSTKNNLFHTKTDVYIERSGNNAFVKSKEGWFGPSGDSIYFAPAPTDDVILSKLAQKSK